MLPLCARRSNHAATAVCLESVAIAVPKVGCTTLLAPLCQILVNKARCCPGINPMLVGSLRLSGHDSHSCTSLTEPGMSGATSGSNSIRNVTSGSQTRMIMHLRHELLVTPIQVHLKIGINFFVGGCCLTFHSVSSFAMRA